MDKDLQDKEKMSNDLEQMKLKSRLVEENDSKVSGNNEYVNYDKYGTTNTVASIIKMIAIVEVFLGIYILASGMGIMGILTTLASVIFTWGFGEIIQILHDIRSNMRK